MNFKFEIGQIIWTIPAASIMQAVVLDRFITKFPPGKNKPTHNVNWYKLGNFSSTLHTGKETINMPEFYVFATKKDLLETIFL